MTNVISQPKRIANYPMINIPGFTELSVGSSSVQQNHICALVEMDFNRCIARVGQNKHLELCSKESQDLFECFTHSKQRQRYDLMNAERERKKKAQLPLPAFDSLVTNTSP